MCISPIRSAACMLHNCMIVILPYCPCNHAPCPSASGTIVRNTPRLADTPTHHPFHPVACAGKKVAVLHQDGPQRDAEAVHVAYLAFRPDGRSLAVAFGDEFIQIWGTNLPQSVAAQTFTEPDAILQVRAPSHLIS